MSANNAKDAKKYCFLFSQIMVTMRSESHSEALSMKSHIISSLKLLLCVFRVIRGHKYKNICVY